MTRRTTFTRRLHLAGLLFTAATVIAAAASLSVADDPPAHAALATGDLAAFDRFTLTGIEPDPAVVDRLWRWSDRHRSLPAADDARAAVVRTLLATSGAVPGAIASSDDWLPPLRTAAEKGDVAARAELGWLLLGGRYCDPDPAAGKTMLMGTADVAGPFEAELIGNIYSEGRPGVPPQPAAAVEYWRRAAAGGNRVAVAQLLDRDLTDGALAESYAAEAKLGEAADAGEPIAMAYLGRWFVSEAVPGRRDRPRGREYFRRAVAATHGHRTDLACELAGLYDAGTGGPADPAAATALYEQAYGTTGHLPAAFKLVDRYTDATTTPDRASRAVAILRHLADRGSAEANCRLANLYQAGLLVNRDPAAARRLYLTAADRGSGSASKKVRLLDAVTTRPVRDVAAPATRPARPATRPARPATRPAAAGAGPTTSPDDLPAFWAWQRRQVEPDADAVARLDAWSATSTHDPERLFVRAALHLGNLLGDRDRDRSVAALTEASDRGYPPAMASLGVKLLGGSDLRPDPVRGRGLLDRAAAANDPAALVSVGGGYLRGKPTFTKDVDRAMAAFLAAAGQGDTVGLVGVAQVQAERKEYDAAVKTLGPLVDAGNPNALATASGWFVEGEVVPADAVRGGELIAKAVEASHGHDGDIMARLGLAYDYGYGVAVDPVKAASTYADAYALGSTDAGNSVALGYLDGIGVPVDPSRGTALLRSLADVGNGYAEANLARQYLDGITVPRDVAAARRLYATAAAWGGAADESDRALHMLDLTPVATPATAP